MGFRSGALAAALCLAVLVAAPRVHACVPVQSQRWFVPIDIGSGVAFGRETPRPYVMEARITPAVGFGTAGKIRLGAQAVGLYRNPEWFGGFGPSVSLRALSFGLEEIALLAIVDHMWWAGDQPSSGASLLLDLDGLFRIGLRVTRDWPGESTSYMINLGADLPNVLKIGRGPTSGAPSLPSDRSSEDMP